MRGVVTCYLEKKTRRLMNRHIYDDNMIYFYSYLSAYWTWTLLSFSSDQVHLWVLLLLLPKVHLQNRPSPGGVRLSFANPSISGKSRWPDGRIAGRMAGRQRAESKPHHSSRRASAVTTAPPCVSASEDMKFISYLLSADLSVLPSFARHPVQSVRRFDVHDH